MRSQRVDDALAHCSRYARMPDADAQVESLLTKSLLILICGEFEKAFRDIVLGRCASVHDTPVRSYIESYTRTILRSLKVSEVKGLLARFGITCKEAFIRRLEADETVERGYNSLVSARNAAAHGESVTVTLQDVEQYYDAAHELLDFFRESLSGHARP